VDGARTVVPPAELLLDFDGTLVEPNVAVVLLEEFAPGGAQISKAVDGQLHRGELTLREAWEREAALLPRDRIPEMAEFVRRHVPLRRGSHELLAVARRYGVRPCIVSGGLDFYIAPVLEREGLDLPIYSDRAEPSPEGGLRVRHPHGHPTCRVCGICKAGVITSRGPALSRAVFVGDGSTDRYAAEVADIVFARRRLAAICEARAIPYFPFEGFEPVTHRLERWLQGAEPWPPARRRGFGDSLCPISRACAEGLGGPA
jgi:2-hydroxy-3-keto-5-methylthiopentenyl-1-phosphate phosphatase